MVETGQKTVLEDAKHIELSEARQKQLLTFCNSVGIHMNRLETLDRALTHKSFAHETPGIPNNCHNERLEFLGDSVLSLVVSAYIFKHYRRFNEGRMTKRRAQIVCESSLHNCAVKMNLGAYLNLGNGEASTGGRERTSILADAFEAVLGAYFLDQGFEAAQEYLLRIMGDVIEGVCEGKLVVDDYKSRFQEMVQGGNANSGIRYETIGYQGPEHDRIFKAGIFLNDEQLGTGEGRTKKEAEQHAAREAIKVYSTEGQK
jgi:ribonuclease-3